MEQETVQTIPTDRKERLGWYLYDFANTSFTVLIVTTLFPRFFSRLVQSATGNANLADAMWGFAGSITMIIIAISSPILGAIADYSGAKKKFLVFYTGLCVTFNALLYFLRADIPTFLGIEMWVWAMILFIIANIGFQGALPFYNAWLPEISTDENIGRIGGYGFAAGYVGAMLTILIALYSYTHFTDQPTLPYLLSALFFLIFAIPSIAFLKNRPPARRPEEEGISMYKIGFVRVRRTISELKLYKGLPLFLVAYFLFSDAITTVIYYASLFAEKVYAFSDTDILLFFVVTQFAAIPGAFIFGRIADKIGTRKTLIITLFIWVIALLMAYFGTDVLVWWIVGMIAGVGMGSSQSTARSMYGQFIPEEKKAEMYGFYALTGKFAAILGPLVYGTVLVAMGGAASPVAHRTAMLTILLFFAIALLLLKWVPQPKKGETAPSDIPPIPPDDWVAEQ